MVMGIDNTNGKRFPTLTEIPPELVMRVVLRDGKHPEFYGMLALTKAAPDQFYLHYIQRDGTKLRLGEKPYSFDTLGRICWIDFLALDVPEICDIYVLPRPNSDKVKFSQYLHK